MEDAIYQAGEEIRELVSAMRQRAWADTLDRGLWGKLGTIRDDIDSLLDTIYQEAGIDFCEDCGARIDDCVCAEEEADDEDEADGEAQVAAE